MAASGLPRARIHGRCNHLRLADDRPGIASFAGRSSSRSSRRVPGNGTWSLHRTRTSPTRTAPYWSFSPEDWRPFPNDDEARIQTRSEIRAIHVTKIRGQPRVLLIDDEPISSNCSSSRCRAGARHDSRRDRGEAIALLDTESFDLAHRHATPTDGPARRRAHQPEGADLPVADHRLRQRRNT
jgi:hypothetical protein